MCPERQEEPMRKMASSLSSRRRSVGPRGQVGIESLEDRRLFAVLVGLDGGKTLFAADTADLDDILFRTKITGLQPRETITSIDFRAATGVLIGLGSTGRLYQINPTNGRTTNLADDGEPIPSAPTDAPVALDASPLVDEVRVIKGPAHAVYSPASGGVITVTTKSSPEYAPGDANEDVTPDLTAIAYDDNVLGAVAATLFGVDAATGSLVRVGSVDGTPDSPDAGQLTTLTALTGAGSTIYAGFDIRTSTSSGVSTGFYAYAVGAKERVVMSQVDLDALTQTVLGSFGLKKRPITDFATVPTGTPIVTTDGKQAKVFDSNLPNVPIFTSPKFTGMSRGESIRSIFQRPSNGQLYGFTNKNVLTSLNVQTGVVSFVGVVDDVPFARREVITAADVDPVADDIFAVTSTGRSLNVNFTDAGAFEVSASLSYDVSDANAGVTPKVAGIAFSAASTGLFATDLEPDGLATIGSEDGAVSPDTGTMFTVGSFGFSVKSIIGFDIAEDVLGLDRAFVTYKASGGTFLSVVDLDTGAVGTWLKLPKGWNATGMTVLE
jgi:hypothetical protein